MSTAKPKLVLYPPQLTGAKQGVITDPLPDPGTPVVGAPKSLFVPVFNAKTRSTEGAATLRIDPIPNGPDTVAVRLFVNGIEDSVHVVDPGTENDPINMQLFQAALFDGVNVVHYVAEDAAGNGAESAPLWVVYSFDLPGGNDVPGTGDHPYLELTLPSPGDWFDKDDFPLYITASYPFTKPYDEITLIINNRPFVYTVQPGEDIGDYVIEVTAQMMAQAGNRPMTTFAFTVRDQLNNYTHLRRRSAVKVANVDATRNSVPALDLIEIPGDVNDEPKLVHLEKLTDFLHALIHVFSPLYQTGDTIALSYTCTPANGQTVSFSAEAAVGRVPFTVDVLIPVSYVLVTGVIRASYKVIRNGQVVAVSRTTEATVVSPVYIDPTISSIIDEDNYSVPRNGSTIYPDIRVSGFCTAKLSVEILVDGRSFGTVPADAGGRWFRDLKGLAVGSHALRVVAVYDPARAASFDFSVRTLRAPVISRVTRANGEYVPPGGTSVQYQWLTVTGTCDPLPYRRWVRLGTHPGGGGYAWWIEPYATSWWQQISYGGAATLHHALYDRWQYQTNPYEKGPVSNYWPIVWV